MASSSYYERLAQEMWARAKNAPDPVDAARFKRNAEEYQILAKAMQDAPPPQAPKSPEVQHQSQQQQQEQPKSDRETEKK